MSEETKRKISGEHCHNAKLNWISVIEIRKKYESGKLTIRELSKEYGVSETAISDAVNNRTWKASATNRELDNEC